MDLSQLDLGQLKQLLEDVTKEVSRQEKAERQAAIDQIYSLAHQFNISLKMLMALDEKKTRKPRSAPLNSYRDPSNPDNTWTGRGPRPAWLKDSIAAGAKLEDFRVPMHP